MQKRYLFQKSFIALLFVLILALGLVGCGSGGGGGLPGYLKVRVVSKDSHKPLEGIDVVLGDSAGALISNSTTGADGIVQFADRPNDAVVTVIEDEAGTGNYRAKTYYGVNTAWVTFEVNTDDLQLGTVDLTFDPVPVDAVEYEVVTTGDTFSATIGSIDIFDDELQDDGTFSILVYALDGSGTVLGYGAATDLSFLAGETVKALTIDVTNADFDNVSVTATNIPVSLKAKLSYATWRKTFELNKDSEKFEPPLALETMAFSVVPSSIADTYLAGVKLDIDLDTDGNADAKMQVDRKESNSFNALIDMNNAIPVPDNMGIVNGTTARPIVSWTTSGAVQADVVELSLSGDNIAGDNYDHQIFVSPSVTAVVVPELPESHAAYAPNNFTLTDVSITYMDKSYIKGFKDYLSKYDKDISDLYTEPSTGNIKVTERKWVLP